MQKGASLLLEQLQSNDHLFSCSDTECSWAQIFTCPDTERSAGALLELCLHCGLDMLAAW